MSYPLELIGGVGGLIMRNVYLAIQAIASYVQEIKGIFRKLIDML